MCSSFPKIVVLHVGNMAIVFVLFFHSRFRTLNMHVEMVIDNFLFFPLNFLILGLLFS